MNSLFVNDHVSFASPKTIMMLRGLWLNCIFWSVIRICKNRISGPLIYFFHYCSHGRYRSTHPLFPTYDGSIFKSLESQSAVFSVCFDTMWDGRFGSVQTAMWCQHSPQCTRLLYFHKYRTDDIFRKIRHRQWNYTSIHKISEIISNNFFHVLKFKCTEHWIHSEDSALHNSSIKRFRLDH